MIAKKGYWKVSVSTNPRENTNSLIVHFGNDLCGSIEAVLMTECWEDWDGSEKPVPKLIIQWLEEHEGEWYEKADQILSEEIKKLG